MDPFTKKDWYDVKAPATFQTRNVGQTLVTRTQGKSESADMHGHSHSHSHSCVKERGSFVCCFVSSFINSAVLLTGHGLARLMVPCVSHICALTPVMLHLLCVSLPPELASDGLKGRVFEVAQADLQGDEVAYRKFRLVAEDVQGKHVLTNFHGMTLTTDKLKSLVKKWQV